MATSNLSPGTRPHAPARFTVDEVAASAEKLPTAAPAVMLRAMLSRDVHVSSLAEGNVVEHGDSNPLVSAVHLAFSRHLPLTLSPDVIWLTIVQGFSNHVNQNAESLRPRLVRSTLR